MNDCYTSIYVRPTPHKGPKDDTFHIIRNSVTSLLMLHNNTVLNNKEFETGVRQLYSRKLGKRLKRTGVEFILSDNKSHKDAIKEWLSYISKIVGFNVKVRLMKSAPSMWSDKSLSDTPCVVIERDVIDQWIS